jgi:dTDP-4-dehydrorhamnose reductase
LKKILLTGGSGLLATNWAILQRNKYDVVIGVHERIIQIESVQTAILHLDSIEAFDADVAELKPDIIIHTAAFSSVELCEKNPNLAYHINVYLASVVATICSKHGIQMVHISTDHLFDGTQPLVSEEVIPSPVNMYAKTKAEAEQQVMNICPEALVIRTNFFGWGTTYRNSFSDNIIQGLRVGQSLNLFNDIFYSPILISELIRITHFLLNKKESGIFHVCSSERISKYEFGIKLAKIFDLNISQVNLASITSRNELVRRPVDMSLSNKKVNLLLTEPVAGIDDQLIQLRREEEMGIASELKKIS